MIDGRSRTTPLPEAGVSIIVADACNGDGESGLECIPKEAEVVIGAKADAALIMMAAATLSTLSDGTILRGILMEEKNWQWRKSEWQ
mmetsp:Transcript_29634/g.62840  ORF Transcript_29634/g.62840 Transcript_29634/m.62840 type:complete len:87 (-) Transcript_29634:196-456(-)